VTDKDYTKGWRRWATGGKSPRETFTPTFVGILLVAVAIAIAIGWAGTH
jgi:hypothetical protein